MNNNNNHYHRPIPRRVWFSISLGILSTLYAGLLLASFATGEDIPTYPFSMMAALLSGQITAKTLTLGIFFAIIFADLTGRATWHLLRYLTRAGQQRGDNTTGDRS
ncbi:MULTISPECIES: hypothetical protein [Actinomycetaceae]|uniref:Uncharacterized protein n=1 Tax=Actinotignum sanguinis TaxID=1445614 RepID=A0ABT5VAB7_9ACTO|nr:MULTISPECIES: hypothetical protein [Actinotignum]MDE1552492.1 hypothetical protein [Actinotignum sanguinis]MDE1577000.1 hypothetical protein [Actinotignum sanguinis]MDE1642044.1 hypothetical protein [Actinotignum sanguinis]MDE1653906.1 hypothetical protein [Actinotignum schaalii]MDE1656912.1 hypothetical protein [Actinotignum sanguinis]